MTGRSSGSGSLSGAPGNGSNGKLHPVSVTASGAHLIEESTTPRPLEDSHQIHATLVIERGTSAGKKFPISSQEANIGRWDADSGIFPDIDLDEDDPEAKISRRHARIIKHNGQFLIEDLGSTNGTFINRGRRLLPGKRHVLQHGDEVIVGKTFLKFQVLK
jgi:hypothetical protein